ncbi:MAG TPA: cation:dicarboxylase symporter family transporter [Gemmatimonadaceae bacterium]|nr:cation:dicarboxylase symporter family transporter [Gemmatimonadaceae bacterium]
MAAEPRLTDRALTTLSLAALAGGLMLGAIGQRLGHPWFASVGELLAPLGELWVSALQMVALPLVIAHVAASIASIRHAGGIGGMGVRAVLFFVAALVVGGLFTLLAAPPLIALYPPDPANAALVRASAGIPDVARVASEVPTATFSDWLGGLLPRNLFEAAAGGEVLGLLLFAMLFGLAVRQLPDEQRVPMVAGLQGAAGALLQIVRWLILATPIGVLALTYGLALETGVGATGLLAAFVVIVSGLMLVFTALIYPATALLGRISISDFARAAAPAQLVAVSTRSSIASLPAMIEGATRLRLPAISTSFVLPLAVALFKPNRTISSTVKLLFVAHAFGVSLDFWTIATFMVTVILLSFSSVGVAGGGSSFKTLPAYLAAGLPIEGVVIMEVVETIPDIFKTVLNVTGDMSVATILSAGIGQSVPIVTGVPVTETTA